ncbi:MAG TPA: sigma 54-interacting transcriptional regulator, partial [Polyangiales bacterium]
MSSSDSSAVRLERTSRSAEIALYGVYEISKFLTSPHKLEVTLARVLHLLSSFLEMRHGLVALLAEDGSIELAADSTGVEESARRYLAELPEQVFGRIVVTQMPLAIPNLREDPLFEGWRPPSWSSPHVEHSLIGVPIKDRGRVIGTLSIDRERTAGDSHELYLDQDVRFLTMIANLLGQTVRLHRMMSRDRERMLQDQRRLEKALEQRDLRDGPQRELGIVGESPVLRTVLDKVRLVARSQSTVMLRGESGTGKELFAHALHELSPRKDRPFITLNCAALPESVLESELFGHEKGAFTGASTLRKGR